MSSSPPLAVFEIVIARGSPAKKGKNAYIKHYFSVNPRAVPEVDPGNSDRVDFRKLNVIQSSEKDQILAEIIPGLPGEEGVNIKGEVDETPGPVHAKLTAGRNVRSSDGETKLYAEIAGHVRIFHDEEKNLSRIDVEEILVLDDVDYSTGHIDFPGTVIVHGTVLDGFEVKARGDIIIDKSIGNVRLSSEGEIVLSGGIVGRGSALVTAESDVFSRYVQDAGIHTHGSIHIEESAINSRLTSGGKIVISEGRGELIGGETLCAEYLKVKKLGARMETPTRIIAGLDPDTVNSLRSLEEDFLDKKNTLSKILTHISQIDEFRKKNPEGAKKEEDTYKKLEVLKEKYEAMVKNISDQMTKIGSSVKPAESSFVEVLESIYPGVEVSFGAGIKNYRVENRPVHQYSRFLIEDGRIILRHS
ncbi:MAG: FapA family protein [Spirochaetia bacterium]|nr:FapA family protein [Spirochaetia bacterium]